MGRARWRLLALAMAAGATGCAEPHGTPTPELRGREAHVQVLLFWGGGEARSWAGELELQWARPGQLPWLWLTDFEPGDLCLSGAAFPAPDQRLPTGWRPTRAHEFTSNPGAPAPTLGLRLETRTERDADGLCFELRADVGTRLQLELGGARLVATLEELLEGARMERVDDSGNTLLAQVVDLTRDALPERRHAGLLARRTALHTHSCFSTNETALEPVVESLVPFVDDVWWTDHVPGEERVILAGDFEDADAARFLWQAFSQGATLERAQVEDGAYHLAALAETVPEAATGQGTERRAWIALGQGSGWFYTSLEVRPVLRWRWRREVDASGGVPCVDVLLNSGRRLRYLAGESPSGGEANGALVLPALGEAWRAEERSLLDDLAALDPDAPSDGLLHVEFGLLLADGERAAVGYDDLALEVPPAAERYDIQASALGVGEGGGRDGTGPRAHLGFEQSSWTHPPHGFGALVPHLTGLFPDGVRGPLANYAAEPNAAERRAFVRSVQAAGGAVGAHHLRIDEHLSAFLEGGGFGVDWIEFGGGRQFAPNYSTDAERATREAYRYPPLSEDEVHPLLVRWDRMGARGLFLTGCGAPDLHRTFERPSYGTLNRWLTWTLTESDREDEQLHALRVGQASSGEWFSDAILSLTVDDRPWMGKVVSSDRGSHRLTAHVSGALPGSRLRWIRAPLVQATAQSVPDPNGAVPPGEALADVPLPGAEGRFEQRIELETGELWRAELRNPAGHLVALSNPVVLLPYWPSPWSRGRVAIDRDGLSCWAGARVALDDARVTETGELWLSGRSLGEGALSLRSGDLVELRGADSFDLARDSEQGRWDLTRIPAGPFALTLRLSKALDAPPSADPFALPRPKELLFSADVGRAEGDAAIALEGAGDGYEGKLPLHYRRVGQDPVRFRLEVPPGRPTWLKLRRHGFSKCTGRLLMDGLELARFERMSAMTFALPVRAPGEPGARSSTFTIELDPEPTGGRDWLAGLSLMGVELWAGEGVVDY